MLQAHNLNREIYFVTDRQRNSLPDTGLLKSTEAVTYSVELPLEQDDNCGIITVDFGGQLILPGHDFTITARIKNYGNADRDDLIASLYLDRNRVAQTDFAVAGGEETAVKFSRSVSYTGFHSGYIELSYDKFPGDHRYYSSFKIPERFNLLIIDGDRTGRLLSLALTPSQNINQYWSVKETTPDNLAGVNFWDYDVIFLASTPVLSATYLQRLRAFVSQGRSVFVTYGPDTDTAYFNTAWSPITGVVYDKPVPRTFSRAGYYSLHSFEIDHPVFSVFSFDESRLPEIKFYALPETRLRDNVRTLMSFTGDRPALVESSYVFTFTGPIDARYSDITGHAFFVPFVSRIAEFLAADLSSYDLQLYCGQNITRAISAGGSIRTSLLLTAPDSGRTALTPEEQQGALVIRIPPADLPGIYSVNYQGREVDRFALNIDPAECDLTSVDTDQFAAAVGADNLNSLDFDDDIASVISESRFGKELWQMFLWLAAVLIVTEILLSRGSPQEQS
jgi:hypothetical protein